MNDKIIIISGDPNSVNSEIIYKSWNKLNQVIKKKIYLISNYNLIHQQFKKLKYKIKIKKVKNINEKNNNNDELKIIDIDLKFKQPFDVNKKSASRFVINTLNKAHEISVKNRVKGIINCPINKKLLNKDKIGVTEYLALKCNVKSNSEVMLIYNKHLSVSPITTHIDVSEISKKLKKSLIVNKIKTINSWFKNVKKKKPKIGILGLNPHNAELRKNSEEREIILPAISFLKKNKIDVEGPLVADTIFIKNYKRFDVIIGMYHDQVLTPFKTLFKFNAINITLGLKYLRVSPDHGVALNLIKKNKANETSLLNCINFVNSFKK
jgi:4-hydroxythreonine-4-phosphate dehydrogenase